MSEFLPVVVQQSAEAFAEHDNAPAVYDLIDQLLLEHKARRQDIDQLAHLMNGGLRDALRYYIHGNAGNNELHRSLYLDKLLRRPRAHLALQEESWDKALVQTGLLEFLPQERRDQWRHTLTAWRNKEGQEVPLPPPFDEATVRPVITSLLENRLNYLAERVDGVFRRLSRIHASTCPEGFSKRMIMNRVYSEYGCADHQAAGIVNDLRAVVAKFMGRDEPKWEQSLNVLENVWDARGRWVDLDGGAISVRAYQTGTLHIEVHPAMAERLNKVLAAKNPLTIPREFRAAKRKQQRAAARLERPQVSFAATRVLQFATFDRSTCQVRISDIHQPTPEAIENATACLIKLGGRVAPDNPFLFTFDVDMSEAIAQLVLTGCLPLPLE
ncbi:DUF4942 domain-containing protein [Duganella vulcania]|uniref:DUF4942 domain-containing protein n=1 Tax=Duganella vulcania TaxID=2692166 RepID=A0A845GFQ8_9BURK|nr:DUF4942 domain-containing protein [Duganella vulcania]MYM92340.1 DUF4942 domain-containing protein [Duganella vulcania]